LSTLRLILIIGDLFAILVAFLIGWLLSGTALSPIHRITQTARDIGMRRDFARRVENRGPNDEIGQLAITFNSMLTELESAYRQVQQALQTQRRFVADASHELRTPLTTIRGNVELLQKEPPIADADKREILGETKDEADRLIRLVNQLLVLARADARRPLRRDPVAIKPLVDDVYRQARLLSPKRRIDYSSQVDATVEGDRDAIKQVLLILVDNALTHTPPNAAVSLSTSTDDGHVSVSIHDTGPGIPINFLPHIFERFARGDVSRSGPGAGLGLSIAKELVEAQSGVLTATSEVGAGSTFTMTLPRSAQ
ncbi:MAG: sensor histidine kinase, partial [Rudaea sp.]